MKHDQSNWINEKDKYYMLNNLISIIKYRFFSFEIEYKYINEIYIWNFQHKTFLIKIKIKHGLKSWLKIASFIKIKNGHVQTIMNSKIIFLCIHVLQILLLKYNISTKDFSDLNQEYETILINEPQAWIPSESKLFFLKEQLKFCPLIVFKKNIHNIKNQKIQCWKVLRLSKRQRVCLFDLCR